MSVGPGNIVAFTMVDLKHQRGAAAEIPIRRETVGISKMIEDLDDEVE